MAVLTVHQWRDLSRGLAEMRRVSRGPVVIVTIDTRALSDFWLSHYLPERLASEQERFPPVADIQARLRGKASVEAVPIPLDCTDGFVEAFYGRPEALLDPAVRAAQSAWQFLHPDTTNRGLATLADDLRSGLWDQRYGQLRAQPTFTGPLSIVTAGV